MKRIIISVFLAVVLVAVLAGTAFAGKDTQGNGLPKDAGKSFNFNVIGVPNQKNWEENSYVTGGSGNRIFIQRDATTSVYVHGDTGGSMQILDRDGTDGAVGWDRSHPGILLPYVGTDGDGYWNCTVYIRLLGNPKGQIDWTTKVFDDGAYVEVATFTLNKSTKFAIQGNNILRDDYQDILWLWDANKEFRIMQFRIYEGAPEGGYPGGNTHS